MFWMARSRSAVWPCDCSPVIQPPLRDSRRLDSHPALKSVGLLSIMRTMQKPDYGEWRSGSRAGRRRCWTHFRSESELTPRTTVGALRSCSPLSTCHFQNSAWPSANPKGVPLLCRPVGEFCQSVVDSSIAEIAVIDGVDAFVHKINGAGKAEGHMTSVTLEYSG